MFKRSISAGVRAAAVAGAIALPSLVLQAGAGGLEETSQIVALVAILGALLIFVEYVSTYPSLIDFRGAPPFNRIRFAGVLVGITGLTLLVDGMLHATPGGFLKDIAALSGWLLDFPFSPVRLLTLVPYAEDVEVVRLCAAFAYLVALIMVAAFAVLTRVLDWPLNRGAFNVLTNLPLFDPTSGGDVLTRMRRDAQINLILGFLLPFLLPALLRGVTTLVEVLTLAEPQSMIWVIVVWAFVPASLLMRSIALFRVAALIQEKRRRAYAQRDGDGFQLV